MIAPSIPGRTLRIVVRSIVAFSMMGSAVAQAADTLIWPENPGPDPFQIPADGAAWKAICADPGSTFIQSSYEDNGDGVISVGDYATFAAGRFGVTHIGFSYKVYYIIDPRPGAPLIRYELVWERPSGPGGDPLGETWLAVCGRVSGAHQVLYWSDGGPEYDGVFGLWDYLTIEGDGCFGKRWGCVGSGVVDVGWAASIPLPTPIRETTWGALKLQMGSRY